ncbi:MAG: hypothetical protein ACYDDO_04850 [Acidiferrobacterales bacterium]
MIVSSKRDLGQVFEQVDQRLMALERILSERGSLPLSATVDEALDLTRALLRGYNSSRAEDSGVSLPASSRAPMASDDLLEIFKVFVKGEPSLNAVRDNIRELVYYRNCIDMRREDALPARPDAMAVRTVRHVYLYLRSRSEQEGRFAEK